MKSLWAALGPISRGFNTLWARLWLFGCAMTLVTTVVGIAFLTWAFRPPLSPFAASAGQSWISVLAPHWAILLLALLICAGIAALAI